MSATRQTRGRALRAIIDGAWLDVVLLALAALAWFATPLLALRLLGVGDEPLRAALASLGVPVFVVVTLLIARWLPQRGAALRDGLQALPLWSIVLAGLALRLVWMGVFPAEPGSDGATYLELAHKLAAGEAYETAGTRAYWPPGYPFFLAAWITVFGTAKGVWLASNLVLYGVAIGGIARLTALLAAAPADKLAALLFALWPNLVAHAATPEKEMLVVALLPWACWVVVRFLQRGGPVWSLTIAGGLLGAAILVQPSLQLLAPSMALLLVLALQPWWRGIVPGVLLVAGAALVIAPWTVRNHQVFGTVVVLSTNGGSNLYRANNPLATGGYTKRGEVDLSALDELAQDREGKRLGAEWIRANPGPFARLAVEKQIRFLGDDAGGVYNTLKVGRASADPLVFAGLKGAANAWWLAIWSVLAAAVIARARSGVPLPRHARLPIWLWLYLQGIHGVFESTGKYHVPVEWVLPVMAGVYLCAGAGRRAGSG